MEMGGCAGWFSPILQHVQEELISVEGKEQQQFPSPCGVDEKTPRGLLTRAGHGRGVRRQDSPAACLGAFVQVPVSHQSNLGPGGFPGARG